MRSGRCVGSVGRGTREPGPDSPPANSARPPGICEEFTFGLGPIISAKSLSANWITCGKQSAPVRRIANLWILKWEVEACPNRRCFV
jgi:hypothetical protein